jgi:integrase
VWRRACGSALPTAPAFRAASGSFWRATDWRNWRKRIYKPVGESVGPAGARPYDLRHAFASLLISAGCSVKAVQHALGHASAATTLNLYSHLWPGDEDRIRHAVDAQLIRRAEDSLRTASADG